MALHGPWHSTASSCRMKWMLWNIHSLPAGVSCGLWHQAWKQDRCPQERATKMLQSPTSPSVAQGFVIWIYFSQGKASCIRSDLVCWCFFQVLLQHYSCNTSRILSLICSNAQATPPPCKCLLKIYELFTVKGTSFVFSRICSAQ